MKEKVYVRQVMDSGWISSKGPFVERFERAYARIVSKTTYAIAVNSGTSALHLTVSALGIGPGDEVILPTFTMIATVNAVAQTGAIPILVDADPLTWNIAVGKIEAAITKRTKAILPVHIYGLPVEMDPILKLADAYNLWVIEDAAEAQGAEYLGKRVGSIGDVAAFSLYANKVVTAGEGGVVTTNHSEIAERVRLLRNYAFSDERHFWHFYLGYAYRLTSLQAAVGLAQVERFSSLVRARRTHGQMYLKLLSGIDGLTFPVQPPGFTNVYWMFGMLVDRTQFGMSRDQLRAFLAKRGIETRTFFVPIHLQPIYYSRYSRQRFSVAERLCQEGLYLPSAATLTQTQIRYIAQKVREAHLTAQPRLRSKRRIRLSAPLPALASVSR